MIDAQSYESLLGILRRTEEELLKQIKLPMNFDPSAKPRTLTACVRRNEVPSCRRFDSAQDVFWQASRQRVSRLRVAAKSRANVDEVCLL